MAAASKQTKREAEAERNIEDGRIKILVISENGEGTTVNN